MRDTAALLLVLVSANRATRPPRFSPSTSQALIGPRSFRAHGVASALRLLDAPWMRFFSASRAAEE